VSDQLARPHLDLVEPRQQPELGQLQLRDRVRQHVDPDPSSRITGAASWIARSTAHTRLSPAYDHPSGRSGRGGWNFAEREATVRPTFDRGDPPW
jgi:hypothetical protein